MRKLPLLLLLASCLSCTGVRSFFSTGGHEPGAADPRSAAAAPEQPAEEEASGEAAGASAQGSENAEDEAAAAEEGGPGSSPLVSDVEPAEDPQAALLAAVEAGEEGRWGEAIELLAGSLAAEPTRATAHLEMAYALLMTGGEVDAIGQHLAHARLLGSESPRLHYLEGLLMEERRRPDMAAGAYERAVEARPSFLDARLRLGRLLLQEGHVEDAIAHLEAAVRLSPGLLPARANLAAAYEEAGRVEDAASQLEVVASLFPDNVFHLHRLAELYQRHGLEEEAREVMRRAEEADPESDRRRMRPLPPSRR